MKRFAIALLLSTACATTGNSGPGGAAPVPDAALGLVKGSVFDVAVPPVVKENESGPGERPVLARSYPDAPPLVPHGMAGFLPITVKDNSCVDCHAVQGRKPGEPTPLPPSHYTDLRNAPGKVGDRVAGARWVCTACHVSQTDAKPLVGNRFSQRP